MRLFIACVSIAILSAACGKSGDSSSTSSDNDEGSNSGSSSSSPGSNDPKKPWDDMSKPYLSDKKLGDFIESLKDANGPFDAVMKGKVTAFNAGARLDEFESAAKKHGFASGEEYLGAWTRIGAARSLIMQEEANQSMITMQEESIKSAQEALKNPEVTPEMRQNFEDRIKGANESLKELKKPREAGGNAKDIETFKKHQAEFDEAMKKWSK